MIEIHRANCRCPMCVAPVIRHQNVVPHKKKHTSRPCPPGCDCGRHNSVHQEGCMCPRHRPRVAKPDKLPRARKNANPEMCVCGHLKARHDLFGCQTCSAKVIKAHNEGKPMPKSCSEFRSKAGTDDSDPPGTYEREVAKAGFIKHIGELATCTVCWTTVKLGAANTLTSVISARAHKQICIGHVRARRENHRPEPGSQVG